MALRGHSLGRKPWGLTLVNRVPKQVNLFAFQALSAKCAAAEPRPRRRAWDEDSLIQSDCASSLQHSLPKRSR